MAQTYSEKLKDPRWQKKRLQILSRDGFKCQDCGDESSPLHVHHKYYLKDKEPWEYPDELLITLCEDCHDIWGDLGGIIHDLPRVLLANGWTPGLLSALLATLLKGAEIEPAPENLALKIYEYVNSLESNKSEPQNEQRHE